MIGIVIMTLVCGDVVYYITKDIYETLQKNNAEEKKWHRLVRTATIK